MTPPTNDTRAACRGLGVLLLLGASGCTKFASEFDTVGEAPDMQTLELDASDWSCVSDEAGDATTNPSGAPLDLRITARDFVAGVTPTSLRIRACYRTDVACMRPATEWLTPGVGGVVALPLTEGFSGYLEITGDNLVPTLYVFPAALTLELAATLETVPLALPPLDLFKSLGEAAQLVFDPGAGVVAITTFDCAGRAASRVRLELNEAGVPFALIDGLPIAGEDTTTNDAAAGFVNVRPGLVVIKGYRTDTTDLVGLSTVLVRAAWVTFTSLMPQFAGTG